MAGNKANAKTKSKEGKGSKTASSTNDDPDEVDFAILRKPIPTSITGFAQARKMFELATEEVKDLLSKECDLLYECKVCRNMFRSLANFIAHKRVYCQEKFSSSIHSEFVKAASASTEWSKIKRIEKGYQEYKRSIQLGPITEENEDEGRIPISKDLTEVIERLTKTKGVDNRSKDDKSQVTLQKIPNSSVAMFQDMKSSTQKYSDKMRTQVRELEHILSRDQAVLQSDGKFTIVSSAAEKTISDVIQISDDDDTDEQSLQCKICELQFSTQKTLRFHMKYKHVESRLVYPCPDCLEIFSTSWSVYRHLFKVHRKSAAQIRRLRESIQSKAFKMDNPPAFYEKRKNTMKMALPQKLSEEERIDQENQAWMDNIEADGEVPRCGGCGRTFERRAALAAHTQTCQPRSRALARRPEGKKIEIQIRKDYNKGPAAITIMKPTGIQDKPADDTNPQEAKPDTENMETNETKNNESNETNDVDVEDYEKDEDSAMDAEDDPKSDDSNELPELTPEEIKEQEVEMKPLINLPYAMQAEKSNLAAFKQRINPHIDFHSLLCKKCDSKLKSATELFNHMAAHFNWKRYACKLCNFKNYRFDSLPEHVKVVHKLKGDSDFYLSTVKAIDGTQAMIISRCLEEGDNEETNDQSDSPERRPSSDSSRLSDDSSSSTNVKEGSRKRKKNLPKSMTKRKKDGNDEDAEKNGDVPIDKVIKEIIGDTNTSNVKTFEENSSDIDDIEDKIIKRFSADSSNDRVSRRPVRNKTKPKNEDFEYDLSNLLKLEAQGYRDSQQGTVTKTNPIKKKSPSDPPIQPSDNKSDKDKSDIVNKQSENTQLDSIKYDCLGALAALSRKAVQIAAAHMRTAKTAMVTNPKDRETIVFARPMAPKASKISPRKDRLTSTDDARESLQKLLPKGTELTLRTENVKDSVVSGVQNNSDKDLVILEMDDKNPNKPEDPERVPRLDPAVLLCNEAMETNKRDDERKNVSIDRKNIPDNRSSEIIDCSRFERIPNLNIPAVLPMKIRRQSLEMMKPIINKNITDFSKAGMKTKILVIKPIKHKDKTRNMNTPLKFKAIKLTESKKLMSKDDQAVLVKVPKVCSTPVTDNITNEIQAAVTKVTNVMQEQGGNSVPNLDTVAEPVHRVEPAIESNKDEEMAAITAIETVQPETNQCNNYDNDDSHIQERVITEEIQERNTEEMQKSVMTEEIINTLLKQYANDDDVASNEEFPFRLEGPR